MTMTVNAIYERGQLRLMEPVDLEEGAVVEVTISVEEPESERSPAAVLAEIAALPLENGERFSGRDHDDLLYGKGSS
jgi:predicted DNA-binding antitoxin AbrB/MazE fold protein